MNGKPARRSWVRNLYLYLAALVGLVLIVIGGVRLVDLGLRTLVFTHADAEETLHLYQPPFPVPLERMGRAADDQQFSEEERAVMRQWLADYRRWQERQERIDPILARRQRMAASSLAMIVIGLPLYLYHWGLIRRDGKRRDAPPSARAVATTTGEA